MRTGDVKALSAPAALPKFRNPPVGEVALAAYFEPLEEFQPVHLGALRARWRDRYPQVEEHPDLPPVMSESAGLSEVRIGIRLLERPPLGRTWFLDDSGGQLVQFQRDRLVHNWRRIAEGEPYPHYRTILPSFTRELEELLVVVDEEQVGPLRFTQAEVTYVNPIPMAMLGPERALSRLLAPWSGHHSDDFLPAPDDVRIAARYRLPRVDGAPVGSLYVTAESSTLQRTPQGPSEEHILLQLFARGRPLGEGIEGVTAFLDLGHDWVVRGFRSVTTDEAHTEWGVVDA